MRQFRSDDTSIWAEKYGNGSDGALTISSNTTEAPIDSACTGTGGTTSLPATNGSFAPNQLILIHQSIGTGVGNWELNRIQSYSAGTITTAYPLINTYASGAQVRVLKQYSAVTVNSSQTYTAKAYNGTVGGIIAWLCNGTTTITGTVSANGIAGSNTTRGAGIGYLGGTPSTGDNSTGNQGYGTGGVGSASTNANGNGGGGARKQSGSFAGGAGGGGHAAAGTNGTTVGGSTGGAGGSEAGVAGLTTMVFGGGGGGGAGNTSGMGAGGGGGIVLIISKTITVNGAITTNGGNGVNANGTDNGSSGAGAGGSILLKGQQITLGSNIITASGGTGGTGSGGSGNSGGGSVGRIHADYLLPVSGTTNPTLDSTKDASMFLPLAGASLLTLL